MVKAISLAQAYDLVLAERNHLRIIKSELARALVRLRESYNHHHADGVFLDVCPRCRLMLEVTIALEHATKPVSEVGS